MADALDLAIAQGPGRVDFSPIGSLPDAYWKGREEAQKQQQRDVFKGGVPTLPDGSPDYAAMSKALYQIGDVGQGNALSDLDIKRQGLRLGGVAGDAIAGTAPNAFPPSTSANGIATQPRPNVATPANTGVVGDNQNSITSFVSSRVGDPERAGPIIARIAQQTGRDPNEAITDPAVLRMVVDAARPLLGSGSPQPPQPQAPQAPQAPPQPTVAAPPGAQPMASPGNLPPGPASGVVQSGQDPLAEAGRFEQEATRLTAAAARVGQQNPQAAAALQARAKALNDKATEIRGAITKYNEAYTGKEAEEYTKRATSLRTAGELSSQLLPDLQITKNLLNDPNYYSGVGETANLFYKRALSALGGDPNTAQPQEAFRKIVSAGLIDQIKGMSGTGTGPIRVAEINIMKQAAASPENTPAGNRTLLEMSSRVAQRNVALADLASRYNSGRLDANFDRTVSQYDREHPLFTKEELGNPSLLAAPDYVQGVRFPPNITAVRMPDGHYVHRAK